LQLYAEHTADARLHPGKHPNIDRLLAIAEDDAPACAPASCCRTTAPPERPAGPAWPAVLSATSSPAARQTAIPPHTRR
jgi:hypothetical protein